MGVPGYFDYFPPNRKRPYHQELAIQFVQMIANIPIGHTSPKKARRLPPSAGLAYELGRTALDNNRLLNQDFSLNHNFTGYATSQENHYQENEQQNGP
jgi:hypothetical protein